jgi:hypothetical protein
VTLNSFSSTWVADVYEPIEEALTASFVNLESNVAHCGAIILAIDGSTPAYLSLQAKKLKLHSENEADSTLAMPLTHKVKAYPQTFPIHEKD